MRDPQGELIPNAHILGFLRRISKLLYFGISPVFVFDGVAPELKRQVIRKRRDGTENATGKGNAVLRALIRKRIQLGILSTESATPSVSPPSTSLPPPIIHGRADDSPHDLDDERVDSSDDDLADDLGSLPDFNSDWFKSLPKDIQHALLTETIRSSRQTTETQLQALSCSTAPTFSQLQIQNLMGRSRLWRALDSFQGRRVESEAGVAYELTKKHDSTWTFTEAPSLQHPGDTEAATATTGSTKAQPTSVSSVTSSFEDDSFDINETFHEAFPPPLDFNATLLTDIEFPPTDLHIPAAPLKTMADHEIDAHNMDVFQSKNDNDDCFGDQKAKANRSDPITSNAHDDDSKARLSIPSSSNDASCKQAIFLETRADGKDSCLVSTPLDATLESKMKFEMKPHDLPDLIKPSLLHVPSTLLDALQPPIETMDPLGAKQNDDMEEALLSENELDLLDDNWSAPTLDDETGEFASFLSTIQSKPLDELRITLDKEMVQLRSQQRLQARNASTLSVDMIRDVQVFYSLLHLTLV